jgi:hypothetical protein
VLFKKKNIIIIIIIKLQVILPQGYEHVLCNYEAHEEPTSFSAILHAPLDSQEKAEEWLKAFQSQSFTTLKIARGSSFNRVKLLYRVSDYCK